VKKRITSLLVAIVLLLTMLPAGILGAYAEETENTESVDTTEATVPTESTEPLEPTEPSDPTEPSEPAEPSEPTEPSEPDVPSEPAVVLMTASNDCIKILKLEEGFSRTPYWDFTQYTVGYGTRCPDDMVEYYTQNGITEEEAETLLRNHLGAVERDIHQRIIDRYGLELSQNQFDALVLFSYNCGTSWAFDVGGTFHTAIASGAKGNDLIRAFALWCSAGNQIRSYLLRRRLSEANMYLNAEYSQTPPDNYCYVLYDANGGTTSPRSQGYDSNLTAKPYPVPTRPGYTFQGWYTAKTGGTKVTVLDASTKSKTLYAQWKDAEGNAPPSNDATPEKPVTVTVTGSDVNLRQGPGTNYTRVGVAQKGQQLVITETATGTGYTWGKFDGGWIALQYTNYNAVVNGNPAEPEEPETPEQPEEPVTPPAETPEEPTTPPTEVPEEPTTPPAEEPEEPVTPPATEPEKPKVTGTVNVQDWLRVRSGPGTSYSVVTYLKPKQKVEILEQSTVGSMKWGKIAEGWISMDYVILDKTEDNSGSSGNTGNTAPTSWTGKVIADELLIRSGPGTNYSVVSYLTYGTKVTVTEKKSSGNMQWGKISRGWICLNYVQLDTTGENTGSSNNGSSNSGSSNNNGSSSGSTAVTGTVNVQDWLRVRTGPGTNYAVAGYLKPKQKVTITEQKTVAGVVWGKISTGWISLDYVILDKSNSSGTTTQPITKTITADCLRVRSGPGTSNTIVGFLYYGAKVQILEITTAADGQWGRISNGWISMNYAK